MTKKLIIAVFVLAAAFTITSCGKKGPLVRPTVAPPDIQVVPIIEVPN